MIKFHKRLIALPFLIFLFTEHLELSFVYIWQVLLFGTNGQNMSRKIQLPTQLHNKQQMDTHP